MTSRTEPGNRGGPPWGWISLGIGAGLLITLVATLGYRYFRAREGADPRTRQVEELIAEAERLLAQGRKAGTSRRKD